VAASDSHFVKDGCSDDAYVGLPTAGLVGVTLPDLAEFEGGGLFFVPSPSLDIQGLPGLKNIAVAVYLTVFSRHDVDAVHGEDSQTTVCRVIDETNGVLFALLSLGIFFTLVYDNRQFSAFLGN
jgi:hypothetical protein